MNVDWFNAPGGTTHWKPGSGDSSGAWMKLDKGLWHYWSEYDSILGVWCRIAVMKQIRIDKMIPAPINWDGAGAPTIGCMCRYKRRLSIDDAYSDPEQVIVFAIDGDYVAIRGEDFRVWVPMSELLPIMTEHQYYTKVRNDGIQKMLGFTKSKQNLEYIAIQKEVCEDLWDVGYRLPDDTVVPYHDIYSISGVK